MIDGPLFSIGALEIYPYGICLGLGLIACFIFLYFIMIRNNFNDEAIDKILFIGICATAFGILMAAVVQGIYNVIAGGTFNLLSMTFQGGLLGGVGGFLLVWNLYVYVIAPRANKSEKPFVKKIFGNGMNATLSDAMPFIPPAITIAHCFGRLGCTFAGCCYGAETDAWYGIYMYTAEGYMRVVPTQLFECIFLAVLSAVMILLLLKFKFNYNFPLYLIAYGIWRFAIEYARDDYRGDFIPGMSPSQFWSVIMVALGIGFIFLYKYIFAKLRKHPELQPPVREKKAKGQKDNVEAVESGTAEEGGETVGRATEESESAPKQDDGEEADK